MSLAATWISATAFAAASDLTGKFVPGLRVCADCGTDGLRVGSVAGSTYDAATNLTTVTLAQGGSLTAKLLEVAHGYAMPASLPRATTETFGAVLLATDADAAAGTDPTKAVTPVAVRQAVQQAVLSWVRDNLGKFPGITPPSLNLFCGEATDDTAPAGTFARSTTGSRLGQAGLIETVAAGSLRRTWTSDRALSGWLIETIRTNLIPSSVDFTQSYWIKTNCTVTSAATVSPDGAAMGSKIVESSDSVASSHYMGGTPASITVSAGSTTFSFFAKAAERSMIQVYMVDSTGIIGTQATFDLSTGSVTGDSGSIKSYGDGWHRCSYTATVAAGTCYARIFLKNATALSYIGDGASGIFVWGAQFEAASFPSSYIPTASTAVTRSADVWIVPLESSWCSSAAGTLYIAGLSPIGLPVSGGSQDLVMIDDGTALNRFYIWRAPGAGNVYFSAVVGGVATSLNMGPIYSSAPFQVAVSWSSAGVSAVINGGSPVTSAVDSIPLFSTLRIGMSSSGSAQWDGPIKHISYFPAALSDSQLQAITL